MNETPFIPSLIPWEIDYSTGFVALLGKGNQALARYDGLLSSLSNPNLLLSPMLGKEAVSSTQIEGSQTTLTGMLLYEAEDMKEERDEPRETLNYRQTLMNADIYLGSAERPFSLPLLRAMHETLLEGSVRGAHKNPGIVRTTQNYIGAQGVGIKEASYIPPPPEQVPALLDNWLDYWRGHEGDDLLKVAVLHAQFELIHPFDDGNGRLGRLLIPLFLSEKEALKRPSFFLSGYFMKKRDEYIERLRRISSDKDIHAWLEFFIQAVIAQAKQESDTIGKIRDLYEQDKEHIVELTHSRYAIPVLDEIFRLSIFKQKNLALGMVSTQTVYQILQKLTQAGILKIIRPGSGRQAGIYAYRALINLCEGRQVI